MLHLHTREVCWDTFLMDKSEGVQLDMKRPVRKNVCFTCDAIWEGSTCGYASFVQMPDGTIRMYYRASDVRIVEAATGVKVVKDGPDFTGVTNAARVSVCLAESKDGKTFTRVPVNKHPFAESCENNIVFRDEAKAIDNFSVFYDENPACPADEKFKALRYSEGKEENFLAYYKSADGIDFTFERILPINGKFDTYNVTFWDKATEQYYLYSRDYHKPDGRTTPRCQVNLVTDIRDIRLSTSKDFITWEQHGPLIYPEGTEDLGLYVNNVHRYYRSDSMFWGMPTRYFDRREDKENFKHLTLPGFERYECLEKLGREASVVNDAVLMISRDGLHFERSNEAFLTAGPENGSNWIYGDAFANYGLVETAPDFEGEANEMSIYAGSGYRTRSLDIVRYTLRLDGFYSWRADDKGGEVLTKPFTFEGDSLSVNFETSARGHLRIILCDEEGNALPDFDSGLVFGNSVARSIAFKGELASLHGRPVRMKILMRDCDLYSFLFT
ncbi:MAG: hypothetical protein J6K61_01935 [Clostridia bacterium]|nr:hypothetical protein [Clostridia bacterium]